MVEYGTYVKHLKVEVYLIEFKLCVHPNVSDTKTYFFSRAVNIGECGNICMLWHDNSCMHGTALTDRQIEIWLAHLVQQTGSA